MEKKETQKGTVLRLLKEGVHLTPEKADEHGVKNLRQHIHFLRKNGYQFNIITSTEPNTYYWIDND